MLPSGQNDCVAPAGDNARSVPGNAVKVVTNIILGASWPPGNGNAVQEIAGWNPVVSGNERGLGANLATLFIGETI